MTVTLYSRNADGSDPVILNRLGAIANWKHSATFPGGATTASFDLVVPYRFVHRALRQGRFITAKLGSCVVWTGRMDAPVPGYPWSCTLSGTAARAKDFRMAAAPGANINLLDLSYVIAAGLPWTVGGTLTGPPGTADNYSDSVDGVLGSLVQSGGFWRLSPTNVLTTPSGPDPLGYALHLDDRPAGRSLSNYANVVTGRYTDSTSGLVGTFAVLGSAADISKFGRIDAPVDFTGLAPMTLAAAEAAGATVLARYNGGPSFTSPITVAQGQITTLLGAKPHVGTLWPGFTARVFSPRPDTGGSFTPPADTPFGQVDYDDETQTVALTPMASDQQDFTSVLAKAA